MHRHTHARTGQSGEWYTQLRGPTFCYCTVRPLYVAVLTVMCVAAAARHDFSREPSHPRSDAAFPYVTGKSWLSRPFDTEASTCTTLYHPTLSPSNRIASKPIMKSAPSIEFVPSFPRP
eukprot:6177093-Pleurochrysis_carterae.AAC.5